METPRWLRIVCNWAVLIVVMFAGVVISFLQFVVTLCSPFLPKKTRIGLCQELANTWWLLFPFVIQVYANIPVVWYGDQLKGECSLTICNHRTTLDFSIAALIATHAESVGCGRLVPLMKRVLRFVPGLGWICYFSGALFLRRNWQKDRAALQAKVEEMATYYPRPFWLALYPEGTRFTEKKMLEAQEFAKKRNETRPKEKQLPIVRHCLLPRPKGFICFAQDKRLRGAMDALNDFTVGVIGGDMRLTAFIKGSKFTTRALHIHLHKTKFKDLPMENEALEKMLYTSFQKKDARLAHLEAHGRYPPEDEPITPAYAPRKSKLTAAFAMWAVVYLCTMATLFIWQVVVANALVLALVTGYSVRNSIDKDGRAPSTETKT